MQQHNRFQHREVRTDAGVPEPVPVGNTPAGTVHLSSNEVLWHRYRFRLRNVGLAQESGERPERGSNRGLVSTNVLT